MNLRSTWLSLPLVLVAGCGLVYDYTGYHPGAGGAAATGGTSATMSSSTGTGGTGATSSSSGGTGGTGGTGTTGSTTSTSTTSTTSTSTTSTTSTSTTTSTSSGCTGTDMCVTVPTGWHGPIVLETGTSPPSCSEAGWGNMVPGVAGGTGTIVPPAGCGSCTCGTPSGGSCANSVSVTEHANGCGSQIFSDTVTTSCGPTTIAVSAASAGTSSAIGASCTGSTPSPTSQPSFPTHVQGCEPPSVTTCTGGVCVPPANHVCVHANGQSMCPMGFPNQTVLYGGITNNYSCTQCNCAASGVICQPTVTFYMSATCGGSGEGSVTGTCMQFGNLASSAMITMVGSPSGGSCVGSGGGTLQGSATGSGPVTVCCD